MKKHYDIVVVGAGIAGLAIAEIYSRSGRNVLLVEKSNKIANGSSSQQHGWFHTGSLYSGSGILQFNKSMLGNIDDILCYYRDFKGMNLKVDINGKLKSRNLTNKWFDENKLIYLYEKAEINKNKRFKNIWKNSKNFHDITQQYDWKNGDAAFYFSKQKKAKSSKFYNKNYLKNNLKINHSNFCQLNSLDRKMNTSIICNDIFNSFYSYGGKVLFNNTLKKYKKKNKKIYLETSSKNITTDKLILATGFNSNLLSNKNYYRNPIASPLLVAYPKLHSSNFVFMSENINKTINHILHNFQDKEYSVIGGGYSSSIDDEKNKQKDLINLKNLSESIFKQYKNSKIKYYFGIKNEIYLRGKNRNYMYNIIENEKNVYIVNPGKFSLAFSLAVNTFLKTENHYPNTNININIKNKNVKIKNNLHQTVLKKIYK